MEALSSSSWQDSKECSDDERQYVVNTRPNQHRTESLFGGVIQFVLKSMLYSKSTPPTSSAELPQVGFRRTPGGSADTRLAVNPMDRQTFRDNTANESEAKAFPTDSKEKEKIKKAKLKEAGVEYKPKKKPVIIEDHFDDCGEDLCSITLYSMKSYPALLPIDPQRISISQPGEPGLGKDKLNVKDNGDSCPGCAKFKHTDDWLHNRIIGQCFHPRHKT